MDPQQHLHLAVRERDKAKVGELLDQGVDINCLFYGWTPLQLAVNQGFEDLAMLLMERGCDVNKQHDKRDHSAYEAAVRHTLPKATRLLLEKGVDPDMTMTTGDPAIFLAVENNSLEILKVLLEGKVDVDRENGRGETALYVASSEGQVDIVRKLLEAGANVNSRCSMDKNKTPLIIATAHEHAMVVRLLLKHGCDINLQDTDSWTALWYAYSNSDEDMMALLLKSGADTDVCDSEGRTLRADAQENDDDGVLELLRRFPKAWATC